MPLMINNSQGDNPRCSTRDENSQPSRTFSPRAATGYKHRCVDVLAHTQGCHITKTKWVT